MTTAAEDEKQANCKIRMKDFKLPSWVCSDDPPTRVRYLKNKELSSSAINSLKEGSMFITGLSNSSVKF